jgi:alkanesulfonate monooxygenase SsuD/methylene tetrahydromethanopterin reductase-like flavin-dependent oxidoreductase (luciferase family)
MQVRSVPTVEFIEPTISNAAADAGRPKPRIIAVVPALVSDDVEGVASAADLAAIGPAESVVRQLKRYLDAGATDVVLSPLDRADAALAEEIWAVAASL